LPLLTLDRIYVRGLRVKLAHAHHGRQSHRLSDHVALSALLAPETSQADARPAEVQTFA
jgi:endonuclease/exonuclease/phosphatase family metal-dependent hydrolase